MSLFMIRSSAVCGNIQITKIKYSVLEGSYVFQSFPSKTSHMHLHSLLYQVVAVILWKDSKSLPRLCTTQLYLSFERVGDVIPRQSLQQLHYKSEPVTRAILRSSISTICYSFAKLLTHLMRRLRRKKRTEHWEMEKCKKIGFAECLPISVVSADGEQVVWSRSSSATSVTLHVLQDWSSDLLKWLNWSKQFKDLFFLEIPYFSHATCVGGHSRGPLHESGIPTSRINN